MLADHSSDHFFLGGASYSTRYLKILAFDRDLRVVQESGWVGLALLKYGPPREHMFSICSLMEFSCGLVPH